MPQPRFLYFDLGNVLLNFSHELACRQMAEVSGVPWEKIWKLVFGTMLEHDYERGDISSQAFYKTFCDETQSQPPFAELLRAGSAIFQLNSPMAPLVSHLWDAGYRLGILSNTNEAHWEYCIDGRYTLLRDFFEVYVLSFRVNSMKPEPRIYEEAAQLCGCVPEEIFFVDDRADNVAGAKAAGFDAIIFESARQVATELRRRGLEFNY